MKRLLSQIELKRKELLQLTAALIEARGELHFLFMRQAERICPIELGTIVQYAPGKLGRVDRIGYYIRREDELIPNTRPDWTVSGRRINQDNELGKLDFYPVGPATHEVVGNSFIKRATTWGLGDPRLPLLLDVGGQKSTR